MSKRIGYICAETYLPGGSQVENEGFSCGAKTITPITQPQGVVAKQFGVIKINIKIQTLAVQLAYLDWLQSEGFLTELQSDSPFVGGLCSGYLDDESTDLYRSLLN